MKGRLRRPIPAGEFKSSCEGRPSRLYKPSEFKQHPKSRPSGRHFRIQLRSPAINCARSVCPVPVNSNDRQPVLLTLNASKSNRRRSGLLT